MPAPFFLPRLTSFAVAMKRKLGERANVDKLPARNAGELQQNCGTKRGTARGAARRRVRDGKDLATLCGINLRYEKQLGKASVHRRRSDAGSDVSSAFHLAVPEANDPK